MIIAELKRAEQSRSQAGSKIVVVMSSCSFRALCWLPIHNNNKKKKKKKKKIYNTHIVMNHKSEARAPGGRTEYVNC